MTDSSSSKANPHMLRTQSAIQLIILFQMPLGHSQIGCKGYSHLPLKTTVFPSILNMLYFNSTFHSTIGLQSSNKTTKDN